ncbi:MAG: ABC-F family ATP-binding cassette domain-containing protein [Acidimicrobiales bacterium]
MILIDADGITMTRPGRPLFDDVSVTVSGGDRIAVVGLNGTGKSTLLDVLAGEREPEEGTVRRKRALAMSRLSQNPDLGSGSVRQAATVAGVEQWEAEAVLDRLGMGDRLDRPVTTLSGGEAKRVALARALVTPSELLVLDEPTNHLDIDAISWLEDRLADYSGALLLVTHDRHVLDRLATRILELDRGRAHMHDGGYEQYLVAREQREEQAVQAERVRRNLARRELAWLRRGAPARTTKAKARIRSATEVVEGRAEGSARSGELDLHFGTPRLGNDVVELRGAGFTHPGHDPLFSGVDLAIDRRERLGVVGANGTGKSTLLEVMAGRLLPTIGEVRTGSTVVMEVFDQHGRALDPSRRVWEAVVGDSGAKPDWRDKALMESFWFDADAQYAPIELLSGGERRRLQLLITLARQPNVLLLDEPTNDLDLDTLRALEDFLEGFPGAVVVVSHDRAFLERTVDDVIVFDGSGQVGRRPGGYEAYETERRRRQAAKKPATRPKAARSSSASGRSASTVRHELKQIERSLGELEARRDTLTADLGGAGDDHTTLAQLGAELVEVTAAIEAAEEQWLELSGELE